MSSTRGLSMILLGGVLLSACGLAVPFYPAPRPLPSPQQVWAVRLIQSGGLLGVQLSVQITSDGQLTAADQHAGRTISQTLSRETVSALQTKVLSVDLTKVPQSPTSCADCFLYDLQITSAGGSQGVRVDDTTLGASGLEPLIMLLRTLRDQALGRQ
jgi:hypothetical protein